MSALLPKWIVVMFATFCSSAVAAEIGPDELSSLVKGRKWMISMQGNFLHPEYWDFNADGSVCPRFGGAKPNDRCADEGRWKLDAQTLCWDLKVIGEHYGYKSACVRVKKVGAEDYEAHNIKGGFRQFVFRPVK